MVNKKNINKYLGFFAVVLFIVSFLFPFILPDCSYWDVLMFVFPITLLVLLCIDFISFRKHGESKENKDLRSFIDTYKVLLLGFSALFSLLGCMFFLPISEVAKSFRGDLVLVIALITFEEELKKKL